MRKEGRAGGGNPGHPAYPPPAELEALITPALGSVETKPPPLARRPPHARPARCSRTVGVVSRGQQHQERGQGLRQVAEVGQPLPVLPIVLLRAEGAALRSHAGLLPASSGRGPSQGDPPTHGQASLSQPSPLHEISNPLRPTVVGSAGEQQGRPLHGPGA